MDQREFTLIAEKYTDIVYRTTLCYCKNKHNAEDAVQNTFIKLLETNTIFENELHIRKWLIRVAINECNSIWNSFWNRKVSSLDELNLTSTIDGIPENQTELLEAVLKLPPKYSVIVHLYYYEGYNIKEIAELLKLSETNVQTRLMRARQKLKISLKEVSQ